MKCYKGTILSVDASDGVYRYLVEDKGQILYIGNDLPSEYNKAEVIDLEGKAIVPAFVDTHQHFASLSTFNAGLNVMETESNEEIAGMIGEYAAKTKNKTIIAFGASPHSVKEGRLITREEMVVYQAMYGELGIWVRPKSIFEEVIERDGKNFR